MKSEGVLFLSYFSPATLLVASERIFQLSSQLESIGMEVHVFSSEQSRMYPQEEKYRAIRDKITYLPSKDIRSFVQQKKEGEPQPYFHHKTKANARFNYLRKLYHSYPFILFSGDGGRTYIQNCLQAADKLIAEGRITHLFSSYRPWADHICCYRLKKKYPHLIWIADFRDLAIDPLRQDVWWPRLQRWYQRRLLRRADIVSTVSEGLAKHFRKDHKRVVVLRNSLPELPNGFLTAPTTTHFTISYTGSLYPQLQTTEPLFAALRQLINEGELNPAQLELHYAGKDGSLWKEWAAEYGLSYLCFDHGMLPFKAAQNLQAMSQLNLLLSWSAPNYGGIMTAKLACYLTAARPIITLLNGPPDPELTAAVEDTGGGFVFSTQVPSDELRLRRFLLDTYRTWAFSAALPWQLNTEKLQPYSWHAQISKLQEALQDLK